jgi:hypothetical protein
MNVKEEKVNNWKETVKTVERNRELKDEKKLSEKLINQKSLINNEENEKILAEMINLIKKPKLHCQKQAMVLIEDVISVNSCTKPKRSLRQLPDAK